MNKLALAAVGAGLIALGAVGAWYGLQREPANRPDPVAQRAPEPVAAPAPPVAAAPSESEPDIRHPIDTPAPAAAQGALETATDPETVLIGLFGRKSVLRLFQLDDFAQRLVATVDNLGRSQAPAQRWPMNPAEGRFLTESAGDAEVISADNGLRYTPYVLLIETVDLQQVAAAYARLYPLLQRAYEELGYPRRYFNDRVVEVLDQLIATPDIEGPIRVRRPVINGPVQPPRPWVLYEFEDPTLQSLTAGQKILLRTGPVNERRLKRKLAELRRLLATGASRP